MKLPVILATYIEGEKSELSLDDTYVLQESDKVEWSTLASYYAGYVFTYRRLVELAEGIVTILRWGYFGEG